jgi:hypothetical protein
VRNIFRNAEASMKLCSAESVSVRQAVDDTKNGPNGVGPRAHLDLDLPALFQRGRNSLGVRFGYALA